jgi:hypothetical protein
MSPTDSSLQNWRIKAPLFIGFDVDYVQIMFRTDESMASTCAGIWKKL